MDGRGVNGHLRAEPFEPLGQCGAPQHGEVGFRGGAQVVQGLQKPERGLGDQGATVFADAADRFGHPGRVTAEQLVIFRGAQKPHDAQLDHEIVDEFLGVLFGDRASAQVAFQVGVEEGGVASERHRRTVLFLDRAEVGEVEPLHGLGAVPGRHGDVEAVPGGHLHEFLQRAHLFRVLLATADDRFGAGLRVERVALQALRRDQGAHAVPCHPAVVADDAAAAVGVGQPGDDVAVPGQFHGGRVDVEDSVVVGFAVLREDRLQLRGHRVTVGCQAGGDHAPAAEGHDGPLERGIRLQAHDDLVLAVDVAGRVGGDRGGGGRVDVVDAAGLFHREQGAQPGPERCGACGGAGQEAGVTAIRRVRALDEVAHVDLTLPGPRGEAHPAAVRGSVGVGGAVARGLAGGLVGAAGGVGQGHGNRSPSGRVNEH